MTTEQKTLSAQEIPFPLKKGTLKCPVCENELHFKQIQGIRLIENGVISAYCPKDKRYFEVKA